MQTFLLENNGEGGASNVLAQAVHWRKTSGNTIMSSGAAAQKLVALNAGQLKIHCSPSFYTLPTNYDVAMVLMLRGCS